MSEKRVWLFREGNADMRNLLGGKGANLAEMTKIGLPVPQGFTITTEACTKYYEDGIYNIDPVASETFDRLFPKKERIADTPSQRRFQEVVAMQKPANPRLEK